MRLNLYQVVDAPWKQIQFVLDCFYYARDWMGTFIAFVAIRLTAVEVQWVDVKNKTYKPHPLALSSTVKIRDTEGILGAAKDLLDAAEARRTAIIDKGKTLVTLSGLFVALLGFLLPKEMGLPAGIGRVAMLVSIGLFTLCLVLLLSFFDIGVDATPRLSEAARLSKDDQRRALILEYCQVASNLQGRSDYLADVYKTARFYFYAAFLSAIGVVIIQFNGSSPDQNEKIIRALRADPGLTNLLKGPPGDRGATGPAGANGELTKEEKDRIIESVKKAIESELKSSRSNPNPKVNPSKVGVPKKNVKA